jgi:hypothetical protein
MGKPIELNPERVLTELPQTIIPFGDGEVSLITDCAADAERIKSALGSLCIHFNLNQYSNDLKDIIDFELCIDDLKINCPALYKKMKAMDAKNNIIKLTNLN